MIDHSDRLSTLPHFLPTRGLSWLAASTMLVAAAASWTAAGYDLGEVRAVAALQAGASFEPVDHLAREKAGDLLRTAQLATAALVAVTFIPWLHLVRCNLRALGLRRLRFGREWTYLGFLIPPLNLYRPFQVMSEVWRGSMAGASDPVAWQRMRPSALVTGWWGALVGWVAAELFSALLLEVAVGLSRVQLAHALGLAADVCAALSASLGHLMVMRVHRVQEEKSEGLPRAVPPAPGLGEHVPAS